MSQTGEALVQACIEKRCAPAILGPTATGKTALALRLGERLPVEIISVDSALVYREMDIGTAKPSPEERAAVPHHLIDIRDPAETYSASEFVEDVHTLVEAIFARDRLPLLAGGTMMYVHALEQGLAPLPSGDEAIRARWLAIWQQTPEVLHQRLREVDPEAAERIRPTDPQRLIRALEVYELTGQPLSHLQKQTQRLSTFRLCKFALMPSDRKQLHERIARRFHAMLEAGFEEEVRRLRARGDLHPELPSMRAVGYRQMWAWLEGEWEWDTMVEKGIVATRQLAKRQITWMRSMRFDAQADPFTCSMDELEERFVWMLAGCVE